MARSPGGSGHGAPALTQASSAASCSRFSLSPVGGMHSALSVARMVSVLAPSASATLAIDQVPAVVIKAEKETSKIEILRAKFTAAPSESDGRVILACLLIYLAGFAFGPGVCENAAVGDWTATVLDANAGTAPAR